MLFTGIIESVDSISRDGLDTPIYIINTLQKVNIVRIYTHVTNRTVAVADIVITYKP